VSAVWACPVCGHRNPSAAATCERTSGGFACTTRRPTDADRVAHLREAPPRVEGGRCTRCQRPLEDHVLDAATLLVAAHDAPLYHHAPTLACRVIVLEDAAVNLLDERDRLRDLLGECLRALPQLGLLAKRPTLQERVAAALAVKAGI